jgi:hypothetical protein
MLSKRKEKKKVWKRIDRNSLRQCTVAMKRWSSQRFISKLFPSNSFEILQLLKAVLTESKLFLFCLQSRSVISKRKREHTRSNPASLLST